MSLGTEIPLWGLVSTFLVSVTTVAAAYYDLRIRVRLLEQRQDQTERIVNADSTYMADIRDKLAEISDRISRIEGRIGGQGGHL